jgi:hypothetical protein
MTSMSIFTVFTSNPYYGSVCALLIGAWQFRSLPIAVNINRSNEQCLKAQLAIAPTVTGTCYRYCMSFLPSGCRRIWQESCIAERNASFGANHYETAFQRGPVLSCNLIDVPNLVTVVLLWCQQLLHNSISLLISVSEMVWNSILSFVHEGIW